MVILPDWVSVDGTEKMIEYLSDPATRMQLREDTDRYWAFIYRGDFDRVRIEPFAGLPNAGVQIRRSGGHAISSSQQLDMVDCSPCHPTDGLFLVSAKATSLGVASIINK